MNGWAYSWSVLACWSWRLNVERKKRRGKSGTGANFCLRLPKVAPVPISESGPLAMGPGGEAALGSIAKCDYDLRQECPAVDEDGMHVISRSRLRSFWETWRNRADAERALSAWYKIASKVEWANFAGLKQTFGSADQVGNCVVFDIGNNRYRLIGRVFYPHKLYVLRVMDHEEYDRVPWASQCGCHSPPPKRRTPPTKRPGAVRRRMR